MSTSILLVGGDRAHRAELAAACAEVDELHLADACDGAADAVAALDRVQPDVVVVDHEAAADPADVVVRALLDHDPALAVVLWSAAPADEATAAALDLGCRAVLCRPVAVEDASACLVGAARWARRLRDRPASSPSSSSRTTGPFTAPTANVVALLGAKGGVGTSTLAVQLARVATAAGRPAVLVDLDLGGPDLSGLLDLAPHRSILDLVPVADHLDDRYLVDALHHHQGSGLQLLPGPSHGERADELDEDVTRRILGALRAHRPTVVVDCGSRLDDATAVALEVADHALLVVTPDVPCLLAARRHLSALDRLSIRPGDDVAVVVNRLARRADLTAPVVGRTLGVAMAPSVPARAAFALAGTDARPESLTDRSSRRALDRLARAVDLIEPVPVGRPHRLGRERGQSAVELLGVLPVLVFVVLVALQALATSSAATAAEDAARAAARAGAAGHDPGRAARAALPGRWSDDVEAVAVVRRDGRILASVRLRTSGPLPWVGPDHVTGEATFAGEEP